MILNNPKVSIIVPVYNAQKFLKETVETVLIQTYRNFELILIDDGSTDNSLSIINKLKKIDSRIKILTQVNKGVSSARKLGITYSLGEYITFLDSDDTFYPNSLEVLLNELKEDDYDIVNGSFVVVPGGKKWIHKDIGIMNDLEYFESIIFNRTFLPVWASLYKKSIFNSDSFEFSESVKIGEDILMNIELSSRVKKVKNINECVYIYKGDHLTSASRSQVRHPTYYKKYFNIRNELYRNINFELFESHKILIENQDNMTLIRAFFSPHINFDLNCFKDLQQMRVFTKTKNLFSFCLLNKYLTQFLKLFIKMKFNIKTMDFLFRNPKKEILY